jgi:hypothetical protein
MKGNRVKLIVIIIAIMLLVFLCPYRVVWKTEQTDYADLPDYHIKALFWEYSCFVSGSYHDGRGYGHDGSYMISEELSIFFGKSNVFEKKEKMMSGPDRTLIPSDDTYNVAVDYIPTV